jgi:hypothetical protein
MLKEQTILELLKLMPLQEWKKTIITKMVIFNLHITAFYNRNSQVPSFVDVLLEDAIYEISGKVNLTVFYKTEEIKVKILYN